jgi:hypothetical protein
MSRRLAAACLALLGACGFTAGAGKASDAGDAPAIDSAIDAAIDASIDSSVDGAIDAPPTAMCVSSGTMDAFQGNTPCSPWATFDSTGGAQTTQNGGKLRVAAPTAATSSSHGGCIQIGTAAWGPEGVFLHVEQALGGISSYTALTAYVATGTPATIVVENSSISLKLPDGMMASSATYVPAQMQWWRLRPVANGIVGETSPDAVTWTQLGTVMGPPPSMIRIDISAGTTGITAIAGTAVFDNLNICP